MDTCHFSRVAAALGSIVLSHYHVICTSSSDSQTLVALGQRPSLLVSLMDVIDIILIAETVGLIE